MSCHVMSCHVMSCRHYCINSKKSFSKTFSFHKIIYKYFAGFLACYLDCHASLHQRWADACSARNDEKNIVITRFCKNRSNPQKRNFIILDCFTTVCNDRYKKQNRTRCAPHGDDDNKNFQFDKFQRLFSVIYKKLINYKGDFKMRNQKNYAFKKQKSKVFLTILCMLGLVFSWSCSCKNRVSNPDDTPTEGGSVITPSITLSTNLMVIDNAGTQTKESITITVDNADFVIADITGVEGLTKDNFELANGVLSLKSGFDKVATTEKTLTLAVNYQKKSTAGANDTLSKTTDSKTFNVVKVEKFDNQSDILQNIISSLGIKMGSKRVSFNFSEVGKAGVDSISLENTYTTEVKAECDAQEFVNDILINDAISIKKNDNYKKYFDDVTGTYSIGETDKSILTIELTFSPKSIYEFGNVKYTITLNSNGKGDWF